MDMTNNAIVLQIVNCFFQLTLKVRMSKNYLVITLQNLRKSLKMGSTFGPFVQTSLTFNPEY